MLPIPSIPDELRKRWDWTVPSPEWEAWARSIFIDPESKFFNPLHAPLSRARIGFLLTNTRNEGGGTRKVGTGGVCKPAGDAWSSAQRKQQLVEWFGYVPDFLITLDAEFLATASPRAVCALVDHELTHCTQKSGADGPCFDNSDRPVWITRPHYAELVEDELRRWGGWIEGRRQVIAEAQSRPIFGDEDLAIG